MFESRSISAYEHQLFTKFKKNLPISPSLVTTIDEFVANLDTHLQYHIWFNHIDFSKFRLAGGSIVLYMLRTTDKEITSDFDFFYVRKTQIEFLDSLVSCLFSPYRTTVFNCFKQLF